MPELKRWIRLPGADEKPGQGKWHEVRGDTMVSDFIKCKHGGHLPVVWEVLAEAIVKDERGKEPNFVMRAGVMVHQFHRVAIPVVQGNQNLIRASHAQLKHFLETVLVLEGKFEHVSET